MEDIICTVPEPCGDKDCPQQYHLAHYWAYDDGTYTVCDVDGDHTDCEQSDVPTAEHEEQLWINYYEYVARTGDDPVHEFRLPTEHKKKRKWQARVRRWLGDSKHGLKVTGVRRRGVGLWFPIGNAPQEVRDYLQIQHKDCIEGFHSFGQLRREAIDCELRIKTDMEIWIRFEVEEAPAPWSAKRIKAYLRKTARQACNERLAHARATT